MKSFPILICGLLLILTYSCKSGGKKQDGPAPKTEADSLMEQVMDGHDAGMSKYGKLKGMQKRLQSALDSLEALPARLREESAPYKEKLDSAAAAVGNALAKMDKWMEEFNMDSALNNLTERIRYLSEEKLKIGSIRDAMISSLQQADSLLSGNK